MSRRRLHRPLPPRLRARRSARRRRLSDLGQPRRQRLTHDHRASPTGDGVLADRRRGRSPETTRRTLRLDRLHRPLQPVVPSAAPGALRVPLMAAKRLPVPDRTIIVLGLAKISSYTGPMVRSVLMGTLDACLKTPEPRGEDQPGRLVPPLGSRTAIATSRCERPKRSRLSRVTDGHYT